MLEVLLSEQAVKVIVNNILKTIKCRLLILTDILISLSIPFEECIIAYSNMVKSIARRVKFF